MGASAPRAVGREARAAAARSDARTALLIHPVEREPDTMQKSTALGSEALR